MYACERLGRSVVDPTHVIQVNKNKVVCCDLTTLSKTDDRQDFLLKYGFLMPLFDSSEIRAAQNVTLKHKLGCKLLPSRTQVSVFS